jgi:hypothetical protein
MQFKKNCLEVCPISTIVTAKRVKAMEKTGRTKKDERLE